MSMAKCPKCSQTLCDPEYYNRKDGGSSTKGIKGKKAIIVCPICKYEREQIFFFKHNFDQDSWKKELHKLKLKDDE